MSAGDWRRGSALRSHRRGHWFDPSIAHRTKPALTRCYTPVRAGFFVAAQHTYNIDFAPSRNGSEPNHMARSPRGDSVAVPLDAEATTPPRVRSTRLAGRGSAAGPLGSPLPRMRPQVTDPPVRTGASVTIGRLRQTGLDGADLDAAQGPFDKLREPCRGSRSLRPAQGASPVTRMRPMASDVSVRHRRGARTGNVAQMSHQVGAPRRRNSPARAGCRATMTDAAAPTKAESSLKEPRSIAPCQHHSARMLRRSIGN